MIVVCTVRHVDPHGGNAGGYHRGYDFFVVRRGTQRRKYFRFTHYSFVWKLRSLFADSSARCLQMLNATTSEARRKFAPQLPDHIVPKERLKGEPDPRTIQ